MQIYRHIFKCLCVCLLLFHGRTVATRSPKFWVEILLNLCKVLSYHVLALMSILRPPKAAIKVYIGIWGQVVLLLARGQNVTTMRPMIPLLFNVQHVSIPSKGKAHPAEHCWLPPSPPKHHRVPLSPTMGSA